MSRLLFWAALIVLVVMAIRSKLRAMAPPGPGARPGGQPGAGANPELASEAMSCCAHCGIYYPASESVRADGLDYCSAAHVRLPSR